MGRGRGGAWVLAALAPAAFLALDPAGWYPFGPAKWLAVSVLVPAGAALVWHRGTVRCDRRLAGAVGLLAGLLAVAAAFGADPRYAWLGTPERQFGVLTWVLVVVALVAGSSLDVDREAVPVVGGLVAAAVGVGGVATAEALGWRAGPIGLGGDRLTGSFGSAAFLGAAAALLLPVAVGVAADRGFGRRLRAAGGLGAGLLVVATAGAGARAAWVGLAAALASVAWARRAGLRSHGRVVAAAGLLAVVGLGVVAVVTPVGERVTSAFDADAPGGRGRVDEWRVAARVVAAHPGLGVGPEGYRTAFAEGADAAYERAHGRDPLPDRAHSGVLDVALAGGVGAALAWLAALALVGRSLLRAEREGRPWLVGLAGGLVAHGVGQLLLFPTFELEPVAWLLAGIVVAATARPGELVERDVPSAVPALLGLLAVVALVAGGFGLAADRQAERAAAALGGSDPAEAVERATEAVALRPDVLRYHLLEARARVAAGEGTQAGLAALDEALALSPQDPVARRERARLLVARARATSLPADLAAARRDVAELLDRDPVRATWWLLAGEVAVLDGDAEAAEAAWATAEDLAPRDPDPPSALAELHLATGDRREAARAAARALALDPDDIRAQRVQAELGEG